MQYIPYCGNQSGLFPQNSYNYLTVEVLLAFFPFSTLCMEFLIQLTFQLFWKVYIVISTIRKIQIGLTTLCKISKGAFHIMEILIVNSLDHLFHISSIEPTDQWRLPQILPQYAKFFPRACSRCSRNITSLPIFSFLFFFYFINISHRTAPLIKKLLQQKLFAASIPFPDPIGHFLLLWWQFWILQVIFAISSKEEVLYLD